jgi:hypothetical protein
VLGPGTEGGSALPLWRAILKDGLEEGTKQALVRARVVGDFIPALACQRKEVRGEDFGHLEDGGGIVVGGDGLKPVAQAEEHDHRVFEAVGRDEPGPPVEACVDVVAKAAIRLRVAGMGTRGEGRWRLVRPCARANSVSSWPS